MPGVSGLESLPGVPFRDFHPAKFLPIPPTVGPISITLGDGNPFPKITVFCDSGRTQHCVQTAKNFAELSVGLACR